MRTVVQKWGHSLALRIPKTMAEHIKVKAGAPVEITQDGQNLLIKPSPAKESLKDLLSKIKTENLHGETQTGGPAGQEVW